jgi:hypothetical protein
MSQDLPTPQQQQTMRLHLMKGVTKSVPFVGGLLEEATFGTMQSEQAAQEAEKLKTALVSIQGQLQAQDTDLGDVLNRLEQQAAFRDETQALLRSLQAFLTDDKHGLSAQLDQAFDRLIQRYAGSQTAATADAGRVQQQIEAAVTFTPAPVSGQVPSALSVDRNDFLDALAGLSEYRPR